MTYEEHADHWPWKMEGRCIYCGCGFRFGQGRELPKTQEEARRWAKTMDEIVNEVVSKHNMREKRIEAGWPDW